MHDIVDLLAHIRVGKGVPPSVLEAISAAGRIRHFPSGSIVFHEGEPCAGVFVLLAGEIRMYKGTSREREQTMAVVNPVVMLNAVAAAEEAPNPMSAVAVQDCVLWHMSCESFHKLKRNYPQGGLMLLPGLAACTRLLISQHEEMSSRPVLSRTAKLLLELSGHGQWTIDRRKHSSYEMSAWVGAVPETLSRSLGILKKRGLIGTTRKAITVSQPKALAELAQAKPR